MGEVADMIDNNLIKAAYHAQRLDEDREPIMDSDAYDRLISDLQLKYEDELGPGESQ